jgi:hypothetical protein
MASENRPGVIVVQQLQETPQVATAPVLAPVIVGPCYQILSPLSAGGQLNDEARYPARKYNQAALTIPEAAFPDPRENLDEVLLDHENTGVSLKFGLSALQTLERGSNGSYGSAFLARMANAGKAAIQFVPVAASYDFSAVDVEILEFAINGIEYAVTLSGVMTPAQVVSAINTEVRSVVAATFLDGSDTGVMLMSRLAGAASSVQVKKSSVANVLLPVAGQDAAHRVEGSGFRGQDDLDSDATSPYIEFYRGAYYSGASVSELAEVSLWPTWVGLVDEDGVFASGKAAAVVFSGSGATLPLKAATASSPGDEFWADGIQVGGGEITSVDTYRFRLGRLDGTLSTFDSEGVPTNRVYTPVEVVSKGSGIFAPKSVYFRANGLTFGDSDVGTAASVVGSESGLDARPAMIQGTPASFTSLSGGTLTLRVTEDSVITESTVSFGESVISLATAVTAINDQVGSVVASIVNGNLRISTEKTGRDQAVQVLSGASSDVASVLGIAGESAMGKDVEFATQASYTAPAPGSTPDVNTTFTLNVEDSFGVHAITATITGSSPVTLADAVDAVVVALGGASGSGLIYDGAIPVAMFEVTGGGTQISTIEGGPAVILSLSAGFDVFGYSLVAPPVTGSSLLTDLTLEFNLDDNPHVYEVTFASDSLQDAIDRINEEVAGSIDIASEGSANNLVLTSALLGAASAIEVANNAASTALGLSPIRAEGEGRPLPDFYVDGNGSIHLSANILRNQATGIPYSLSAALADVYVAYRGLRKDVTPSAASPALLAFTSTAEIEDVIGPVSSSNPLALGVFLALQASPEQIVYALGVDEVSDAAPMGTVSAWARAAEFLESKEVYAIAPLTDDLFVQQLIAAHVATMSEPEQRGERIALLWQNLPTRNVDTSIQSGSDAGTNGVANSFTLGANPGGALISAGISDLANIEVADEVYLEVVLVSEGSQDVRRYSVSSVNGVVVNFRTSFAVDENTDGFFSTVPVLASELYSDVTYAIRIRGESLTVAGTNRLDVRRVAEAAAAQGEAFTSRRVFSLFMRSIDVLIGGIQTNLPGYYAAAATAGMVGQQAPQQPFTNLAVPGLQRVYGTDDTFSENQLDTVADGGRYVLVNFGGQVSCRHQRSTDSATIERRELSITKAIDWMAKNLRELNRRFIGRYVINPGFIDQLTVANEGFLRRARTLGVVNDASLVAVLQDESAPDTVLIEIEVAPAYPCNKIRITIVS